MSDLKYWISFNRIRRLGTVRFRLIEEYFGVLEKAWRAPINAFKAAGLDSRTVDSIAKYRPAIDPDSEMEKLQKFGVIALNWRDERYPPLLKEIPDPPPVLYVKGSLESILARSVAVVGTRRATAYGREATLALTTEISRSGITIISGLARGIDTIAHRATLDAGGSTVAVMASGVDYIYPSENRRLAAEIAENGALVGEHPLGVRPDAFHFPRRNRLMSGLSLGTLLVEAPVGSGAIWTVRHALEQNRDVFCVPGSIFAVTSDGPNKLIGEGAKPALCAEDILEDLNIGGISLPAQHMLQPQQPATPRPSVPVAAAPRVRKGAGSTAVVARPSAGEPTTPSNGGEPTGPEAALLELISAQPTHIDELCRRSKLPMPIVSSTLTLMEVQGMVTKLAGMNYTLNLDNPRTLS